MKANLEVIDKLCKIFDGVDVVMWRWTDQANTLSRVPCDGYVSNHFMSWQLSSFSRLGSLLKKWNLVLVKDLCQPAAVTVNWHTFENDFRSNGGRNSIKCQCITRPLNVVVQEPEPF